MLDTLSHFETPEGAVLELRPASVAVRALAWLLDILLRGVILIAVGLFASLFGELGMGFYLIVIFALTWFYNVLFEVMRGATPGKKAFGLTVVQDNGAPITWSSSFLRNLLRVVDSLPLFYGLGLLWGLFNEQSKRLGDIAAGTLVVYRHEQQSQADGEQIEALKPPLPIDYATQNAILSFAERRPQLSPSRQEELAELFQPIHQQKGPAAITAMLGYARYIAGDGGKNG